MIEQLYDYCSRCLWVADYTCGCEDGQTVFPLVQMTHGQAAIAMEARKGRNREDGSDPKDDSAGPQDIAQGGSHDSTT